MLLRSLFAVAMIAAMSLTTIATATAATAAPTTTCSNGVDDTPGLGLICQVTVVNTITASGGSARVTIRECHGAAGSPTAKCSTKVTLLSQPVSRVRQCNFAVNGGGGTLRCSVKVTNNFVLISPGAKKATVDQCVGSGGGITTGCDPFPATTTNATITQCNGSANGGTLVQLKCTASGTRASAFGVTVNQCNNAANGGGSLVICSASIVNRTVAAAPSGPTDTAPPTSTDGPVAGVVGSATLLPVGVAFFVALLLMLVYTDRRRRAIS
jgi:hypothetical protein